MSKIEVDTIAPQSGTQVTIGESGDTVTIPTGVTLDASNATTTLPATVVTTTGSQILTNKSIDSDNNTITNIVNADIKAGAAIDYSKLNLTGNIVLADLSATGTKDSTTFLRGDNTFAVAGGTNTPAFAVYNNGFQSTTSNVNTKATFDTEVYDTASAFASSRFTVPSGQGGKYYFYAWMVYVATDANATTGKLQFYKNGSGTGGYSEVFGGYSSRNNNIVSIKSIDLSAGDYVEVYGTVNGSGTTGLNIAHFGGFKIIE